MITESQIKAALKRIGGGEKKSIDLRDGGPRGAGRLAMIIRASGERVISEWYAIYFREGKRTMAKVGSYPSLMLGEARKKFREEYAPAISAGADPAGVAARRRHRKEGGTVRELFEAYVASLKAAEKRSAGAVERMLLTGSHNAVGVIGGHRVASGIAPGDIVPHLAAVHSRGSIAMAATARAYLSAAFAFGLKGEHDYTQQSAGMRWGLKTNPVAAIPAPRGASKPGQRFLTPSEFRTFWLWLEGYAERSCVASAARLMLATGQRAEEVLRINEAVYEKPQQLLYWEKTKNGLPHSISLPQQAVAILEGIVPNSQGWFFPNARDATRHALCQAPGKVVEVFLKAHPDFPRFVAKDIRRTWKTLAGSAGLSKEMRDRLQNHTKKSDVSSRYYDRYDYLAEKREAMAQWAAYLALMIAGEINEIGQRELNVVPIGKGAAA